jgi:CubicO group peptidase (beta-lactamase class C family)
MTHLTRRQFGGAAFALASARRLAADAARIDDVLRSGIERRKIPCVAAMVATRGRVTYQGAFGTRDSASGIPIAPDAIFSIASMTKAVTSAAALQLVERGKVKLDEPVSRHLPQLAAARVLDGYDSAGQPILRPPKTPVTLRHLLTHTSGLCYAIWSREMTEYGRRTGTQFPPSVVAPVTPLMFDPGSRWQYGTGIDFAGKLVEALSGLTLEQYFQEHILGPLGMSDTSYVLPPAKFDRLVTGYSRQSDGSLRPNPRAQPVPPKEYNGGGGLFSTCADYVKFMQVILRHGARDSSTSRGEILKAASVALMTSNQIGSVRAGILTTTNPAVSADVDFHPGRSDRFTLGFLINSEPYPGGRSAGSLAWAGISNTFYWIDPPRDLCAVIMMQFLPFVDPQATALLRDFERAVYTVK